MATINEMRQVATQIENETQVGGNTAGRVGGLFNDIVDKLESVDELNASDIPYDNSQSGLAAENVQGAIDEVGKDILDMTTTSSTTLWNQGYCQTTTTTERSDVIYSRWQWYPDGVTVKTTEDYRIHSFIVMAPTPYQVGTSSDSTHVMYVKFDYNFVINIKRVDGQNLTPTDGASNVTLNTATTVLKATDIVDDVLQGGSGNVLSAEQGKRIADSVLDTYIFDLGDINYQTGKVGHPTNSLYLKDYIGISTQVTATLTYKGNALTVGNRYYDANKAYLGTSYSSSAKYWRVSAALGENSDVETINAQTILTINGERYYGGNFKATAEKVYLNDMFKDNEIVQNAIDELKLKTGALGGDTVAVLPIPADSLRKDRVLVWHDEFNTPTVSEKWDNLSGAYNQNYYMGDVNKNAFCMDNSLHLTNLKDYPTENFDYSGAFLLTNKKFDFRYGLIEAKIKFPDNYEHFHSTLWMIGSSFEWNSGDTNKGMRWPKCGEIDIAECDDNIVNSTVHWGETEDASSEQANHVVNSYGSGKRSGWHIYSLEWTSTGLSFYCDGQLFSGIPLSRYDISGGFNAFKRSMYFALNQNPHNVKNPRQWSTLDEITTEVAWIRVYAPAGVTPTIPTTATLSETSLSMNLGDSVDLDVTFDNDETVIDRTVVWESYNEDVATFHGGRVIATGVGTTFVACTHKYGARALCKVVVS